MTADLILYLMLGLALGGAYFAVVWRTVRLHMARAPALSIALHFGLRLTCAGAVFWLVAQAGAWPLLVTFAGFLLARVAAGRIMRRAV